MWTKADGMGEDRWNAMKQNSYKVVMIISQLAIDLSNQYCSFYVGISP